MRRKSDRFGGRGVVGENTRGTGNRSSRRNGDSLQQLSACLVENLDGAQSGVRNRQVASRRFHGKATRHMLAHEIVVKRLRNINSKIFGALRGSRVCRKGDCRTSNALDRGAGGDSGARNASPHCQPCRAGHGDRACPARESVGRLGGSTAIGLVGIIDTTRIIDRVGIRLTLIAGGLHVYAIRKGKGVAHLSRSDAARRHERVVVRVVRASLIGHVVVNSIGGHIRKGRSLVGRNRTSG